MAPGREWWLALLVGWSLLCLIGCSDSGTEDNAAVMQTATEPTMRELGLRLAPKGLNLAGLSPADVDQVVRGSYLVNSAGNCAECHTATVATDPAANHAAHFTVDSSASINRFNDQIANQIGTFPFSSSVSGFTFAFEPSLGTFLRTTETLGPLFAERAPTLGGGKLNVHFSYTFFTYDTFGGKSLQHFPVIARHEPDIIGFPDTREQFEFDTVHIDIDLKLRVQIFAFAATYGITDRLDVGLLLPITSVDMTVKSRARIVVSPNNTLFPGVHTFVGGPESPNETRQVGMHSGLETSSYARSTLC